MHKQPDVLPKNTSKSVGYGALALIGTNMGLTRFRLYGISKDSGTSESAGLWGQPKFVSG